MDAPTLNDGDKQVVVLATLGGETFKQIFYEVIDSDRSDALKFFHDNSALVWNGSSVLGLEQIGSFFSALPSTKHIINDCDCQPIGLNLGQNGPSDAKPSSLLVTVSGEVTFGGSAKLHHFRHAIVLERDAGRANRGNFYYVVSFTCRSHDLGKQHNKGVRTGFNSGGQRRFKGRGNTKKNSGYFR